MQERPRKPRGRAPAGASAFPHVHSLRFSDRDEERLEKLAAKLEITLVDVVRRALRELAKREGVE